MIISSTCDVQKWSKFISILAEVCFCGLPVLEEEGLSSDLSYSIKDYWLFADVHWSDWSLGGRHRLACWDACFQRNSPTCSINEEATSCSETITFHSICFSNVSPSDIWSNRRAPGCLGCHRGTEQSPWCRCIWVPSGPQGLGSVPGQERDQTHGPPPETDCSLTAKTFQRQKTLLTF